MIRYPVIPFRHVARSDNELDALRQCTFDWICANDMVRSPDAFRWYAAWDIERLVGDAYPLASGAGLELCAKVVVFTVIFDDHLDGMPAEAVADSIAIIQPFIDILHGVRDAPDEHGLLGAFAELWREQKAQRSPGWIARGLKAWEYYFSAVVHETVNRALGGRPRALDVFLESRRGSGAMHHFLDVIEPGGAFELHPLAFHAPSIRAMRQLTIDIVDNLNDYYSLPKELARGQTENLVITLRDERGWTLETAVEAAADMIEADAARFLELRADVPKICAALGLDDDEFERTLRYVDALEYWMGGFEPWQRLSPRYTMALTERPASGPWATEAFI